MVIFDEFDIDYRSPQGALKSGTELCLRVKSKRGSFQRIIAKITPDGGEVRNYEMSWQGYDGSRDVFAVKIQMTNPELCWLYFSGENKEGACSNYDRTGSTDEIAAPYQITVYDKSMKTPDWFKGTVMYHIFIDRFCRIDDMVYVRPGGEYRQQWGAMPRYLPDETGTVRNNDFFGGSLWGVAEKLPYLKELGVGCIYLSPAFDAASNHKYDTGDYMSIDEGFGGEKAFDEMCRKADEKGIRIILDGVFNHVGVDSRYFNKYGNYNSIGAYQSQQSPCYDWFSFTNWNQEYASWWGISLLPSLSFSSSCKEFIAGENGVLAHWQNRGASGWRLDVVDELGDEILDPICSRIRQTDDEALVIGEVWEDASNKIAYDRRRRYFLGGQLDSVMNYPLKDGIISYVKYGDTERLAETMSRLCQNYPKPVLDCLMNILGTHDTMRILTVLGAEQLPEGRQAMSEFSLSSEQRSHGIKLLKIASALLYTLPGVPCIYYGDEAGMQGGADPFCRGCYPWGHEDEELRSWYKKLGEIRQRLSVFKDGDYELIAARDGIFAFRRRGCGYCVVTAANINNSQGSINLSGGMYECLSERSVKSCTIPPQAVCIFTERPWSGPGGGVR